MNPRVWALLAWFASAKGVTYTKVDLPFDHDFTEEGVYKIVREGQLAGELINRLDLPCCSTGVPGAAVFDYDRDGYQDIYLSNCNAAKNSLFKNNGDGTFTEMNDASGTSLEEHNGNGVCFGDVNNDGYIDLMVLGRNDSNVLLHNNGDGTFTEAARLGGYTYSESCSFADFDNDGYLDLFVGNGAPFVPFAEFCCQAFVAEQHNEVWRNNGDGTFTDRSDTSLIQTGVTFEDPQNNGNATISWAVATADVNMDGYVDIIHADDDVSGFSGVARGHVHVWLNQGDFTFVDSIESDRGSWMGLSIGDMNCDGKLDIFASDLGAYFSEFQGSLIPENSRVIWGNGDGTFEDLRIDPMGLKASPFGWGQAIFDADNDGDLDLLLHGTLNVGNVANAENVGTLYMNSDHECGTFENYGLTAFTPEDHQRRNVKSVAVGDFNNDGFIDIVSGSSEIFPEPLPLEPMNTAFGEDLDDYSFFFPMYECEEECTNTPASMWRWSGVEFAFGDAFIEMNGGNDNNWVSVTLVGGKDLISSGTVNRDGIGAILSFTVDGREGSPQIVPVDGGSSYASHHSLTKSFGLGMAEQGTLDIMWSGGHKNRVVMSKMEMLNIPEIPCSYDDSSMSLDAYKACVRGALEEYESQDSIIGDFAVTADYKERLYLDAVNAFQEENGIEEAIRFEKIDLDYVHDFTMEGVYQIVRAGQQSGELQGRFDLPCCSTGIPGAAIFDYDNDGYQDIYLANCNGARNSLFKNEWATKGQFTEMNDVSGTSLKQHNGNGVCYGDVNNDGYMDLMVLGRNDSNVLLHNNGDGTFTEAARLGGYTYSESCSFADFDNDGYLDLFVGNGAPFVPFQEFCCIAFVAEQHNEVWRNNGDGTFTDMSESTGIQSGVTFEDPSNNGNATISWAVATADVDMDGYVDIIHADDDVSGFSGVARGHIHVWLNQGDFTFVDSIQSDRGSWMGLSIGDVNCDGNLDIFGSDLGAYFSEFQGSLIRENSRVIWGNGDGTFDDLRIDPMGLNASPFGWGQAIFDADNDGDLDLLLHGTLNVGPIANAENVGTLYLNDNNDCGTFSNVGLDAFDPTNHLRRHVKSVAVGDLNNDGFVDIVSGSSEIYPEPLPLEPMNVEFDEDLDDYAYFFQMYDCISDCNNAPASLWEWSGVEFAFGDAFIEMNQGNSNNWAAVRLVGTAGITAQGTVNRAGIGAVLSFMIDGMSAQIVPVDGGSSYASHHSIEKIFGLGMHDKGTLDILWPGGTKNQMEVHRMERLKVPEIPCSYTATDMDLDAFEECVDSALDDMAGQDFMTEDYRQRLYDANVNAYKDFNGIVDPGTGESPVEPISCGCNCQDRGNGECGRRR